MATVGLGFQLSANASGMAAGINAGVVELQKLGYAARQTQKDVSTLKTIELSRVFLSTVQNVVGSFAQFVSGTASAVASVDDLSRRTGVATQVIQAYQFAAEQSGVGVDTFGRSIQKLGINLGEAQTGNKAAIKSFEDLGLSVTDLANLSPQEAFEAVAAAIAQLPNPAQQAAAAVSVFGKSGAELVPVFQEGAGFLADMRSEAERLKVVLSDSQTQSLAQLDDAIGKVADSFQGLQARVVAELAPALIEASNSAATFIANIDVADVAKSAETALAAVAAVAKSLADAFSIVYSIAAPLASAVFPVIATTLGVIAGNLNGAAVGATAAAVAVGAYAASTITASAATAALTTAITSLLSRTGIGLLVVLFGSAAGALVSYAATAESSALAAAESVSDVESQISAVESATKRATDAVKRFGSEAASAFKVPAAITDQELLQGTIDDAASAFKKVAQEAGRLSAVPQQVVDEFEIFVGFVEFLNDGFRSAADEEQLVVDASQRLVASIQSLTDARKAEEDATKAAADAAKKASEEARKRTEELAKAGLSEAELSRLQLSEDLLAIARTIADAEADLASAKAAGDARAIAAAETRLALTQETATAAARAAEEQARQRDLRAIGLDESLLQPAKTLTEEFLKVRQAFADKLINPAEATTALQNLAKEGINIRREIAAELNQPAQQALQVNDLRTSDGASQYLALATGRADPAIAQREEQLRKLDEIRRALEAVGARPVDILGG